MNVFQFMSDSPFLSFSVVYMITQTIVQVYTRTMRVLSVRKAGWPPAHLDADGDWKPGPEVKQQTG